MRVTSALFTGLLVTLLAGAAHAAALFHAPHDVASTLAVSPDFANDGTLVVRVQLTNRMLLARSTDGGDSWELIGAPMMVHGVKQLAFSPDYAVDRTLFAATDGGGVWRSLDGGDTWHDVSVGLTSLRAQELGFSPQFATDDTLLVATVAGVFRSTDRGDTWTSASVGLVDPVLSVFTATNDPDVYFTGRRTMYRTDDGGDTWTVVQSFTSALVDIEPSPTYATDDTVTVCFGRHGGGILVSEDRGQSFVTSMPADEYVNDVEFADDGTVLVVTETGGCFVGPNAHGPWVQSNDGFEELSDQTDSHYTDLALSPTYASDGVAFVAAFEGLHRTGDVDGAWEQCDVYSQLVNKRARFAPDFDGSGEIYFGNYGGGVYVYRVPPALTARPTRGGPSQVGVASGSAPGVTPIGPSAPNGSPAAASPWSLRATGIGNTYCLALALSPAFAQDGTAAYAFAGMWRSVDAGSAWDAIGLPTSVSVVRDMSFSPGYTDDLTVFASTSNEPQLRSLDGGLSWQTLSGGLPPDLNVQAIGMSPDFTNDGLVLLGGDPDGIWRSTDGGDTWTAASTGLTSTSLRAVEVSPNVANDQLVLAGSVGDGVFRSTDGGATWSPSNTGLPTAEPLTVESIAFSPTAASDGTVFAAFLSQGLQVSYDMGVTWQPVGPGLPRSAPRVVAVSPSFADDRTLVVTTYDWSYLSRDAGASWERLPGFQRVDDKHQSIQVVGDDWIEIASPGSFGARHVSAATAGHERSLTFRGRSITWYATRDGVSGQADVFVDGALAATVDLYAPSTESHVPAFQRTFADVDWHTITIRVTGTASAPATDTQVQSDGFAYTF